MDRFLVTLLGLVIEEDDKLEAHRRRLNAKDDRVREAAARVWVGSSRSLIVLAERTDDPPDRAQGNRRTWQQERLAQGRRRPSTRAGVLRYARQQGMIADQ